MARYRARLNREDDFQMTGKAARGWNRAVRRFSHQYSALPTNNNEAASTRRRRPRISWILIVLLGVFALFFIVSRRGSQELPSCDQPDTGYGCRPEISHFWGQYSPWFSVHSEVPPDISPEVPSSCSVTFVQFLSRHGGRYPTSKKTVLYAALVAKLHESVESFNGKYTFLEDYDYELGADDLTPVGEQEMVNAGLKFFDQYRELSLENVPFVRAAGEYRVLDSAKNWTQGFHKSRLAWGVPEDEFPYDILMIPEDGKHNNSLNHGLCPAFENGPISDIGVNAQAIWMDAFVPQIQSRLNEDLPGADLSKYDVVYFMDLCPFETMASPTGKISQFCDLFTEDEWHQYDYLQSLGKYYGHGPGNPLGPTQGVGFVNELIARLTGNPVQDSTSTNRTLDADPTTFPLDRSMYADFSHDNDMMSMFGALGLYNSTAPLSNTTMQSVEQMHGYSASWAVPFAGRAVFEKMECEGEAEEMVRVLVNDRVIPLDTCDADVLGRCSLSNFVDSLSFAASGGHWGRCFAENAS